MNRQMTTACAALALLAVSPLFGGELWVAPDGLSPHAALRAIRAAKAKGDTSAWTVRVAPGRYVLAEPLVMRPEDSGSPSAPVRWVAEGFGEAVFAGGDLIVPWDYARSGRRTAREVSPRLATMPVYSGSDGEHAVEIEVLEEQPDRTKVRREATDTPKYDGTWFQPCQILLVGDIVSAP